MWVETSNANTLQVIAAEAPFTPEDCSVFGNLGLDEEILQLPVDVAAQKAAVYAELVDDLRRKLVEEQHPEVRLMPLLHVLSPRVDVPAGPVEVCLPAPRPAAGDGTAAGLAGGESPDMAWIAAAHELGHALQFYRSGPEISLARAFFDGSSDTEGWAVYFDSEVAPHLPPEARLMEARHHERRTLRALLELDLRRGRISSEAAAEVLRTESALDDAAVRQELVRFHLLPGLRWRKGPDEDLVDTLALAQGP